MVLTNCRAQLNAMPPDRATVWPVIYSFPISIITTWATSSPVPNRPSGIRAGEDASPDLTMSVSISDGATALTVMPCLTRRAA